MFKKNGGRYVWKSYTEKEMTIILLFITDYIERLQCIGLQLDYGFGLEGISEL